LEKAADIPLTEKENNNKPQKFRKHHLKGNIVELDLFSQAKR